MNTATPSRLVALLLIIAALLSGGACRPRINLYPDPGEALKEFTLEGEGREKILLIHLRGALSTSPDSGLITVAPSPVQEVISRLAKSAEDKQVKAVILAIHTPGGTVTASDILHQHVLRHKQRTGQKVVALLMDLATSGGYYIATAADSILAHPTTITGSVGTVFIRPDLEGLMGKIGVQAEVVKSGKYKDIFSIFRHSTEEERAIMQELISQLNSRFLDVVRKGRNLDETRLQTVAQASVLTAPQAQALGLVDGIGYFQEALEKAKEIARLDKAKLVVYRREEFKGDTAYNSLTNATPLRGAALVDLGASGLLQSLEPGFHYIWLPALVGE